ncbi:MAG: Crp/Fnr family transcriptional regulator, partial [Spirochaetales bacterium]|nr:Crp/Fnr family transcriptional regulator [Spirochaetales bacterium]
FLMLSESQPVSDDSVNARTFMTTVDDIAHWAGVSPVESKRILSQFASQRRLEIFPDKIIVQNINDFARFVSSKRRSQVSE